MKRNEEHAYEGSQSDNQQRDAYRPDCLGLRLERIDLMTSRRSGITEDGEIFHLTPKFLLLHDFPALATHLTVV